VEKGSFCTERIVPFFSHQDVAVEEEKSDRLPNLTQPQNAGLPEIFLVQSTKLYTAWPMFVKIQN
jgi:hypothetical protein